MKNFILNNIDVIKNNGKEYLKIIKLKKELERFQREQEKNKIKKHNVLYLDEGIKDNIFSSYIFKCSVNFRY